MPTLFPIRFDAWYAALSRTLLLPPRQSYLEIDTMEVRARMGWAFRAAFPLSSIASVTRFDRGTISRGVHGFGGRWLVNGSGTGILDIELRPTQRAFVMGFPVRLQHLLISLDDSAGVEQALKAPRALRSRNV